MIIGIGSDLIDITRVAKVKTAGELTVQIPIPPSFQASQGHHLGCASRAGA